MEKLLKSNGSTYKLLIVDDSPMIHKMIKKAVLPYEIEIVGNAKNGKEAVDLFMDLQPDIVTMDVTMPIMDGIEASKNIIAINQDAKILMLSAMGDEDLIVEAKESGVSHTIKKPFKAASLMEAIKIILGI